MNRVNVLYQFDDKYAPYAGISMTSLLENSKGVISVFIYGAAMGVSEENKDKINRLVQKYRQQIIWLDTTKAIEYINSCKTGEWNGSKATWMKIFLIQDLPDDVETILYLDSDTIVCGNIGEIAEVDLTGYPIACAYDSVAYKNGRMIGEDRYYNAGVTYYNVRMWKQDGFFEKMLEHLYRNVEWYPDNDQRLLNDYFRGQIRLLPMKFNFQGLHLLYSNEQYFAAYSKKNYYSPEEIEDAREHAVVHHFFRILGDYPWEDGNWHPSRTEYEYWKSKTEWKDLTDLPKKRSATFVIERMLFKFMPKKWFLKLYKAICDSKITY